MNMSLRAKIVTSVGFIIVVVLRSMMNGVAGLIEQNLESSRQVGDTTGNMSSQANMLLHSVVRFKIGAETPSDSVTRQ